MAQPEGKVQVTQAVYDELEAIRTSGVTNMFDYGAVCRYAQEWGYEEAVEWLRENIANYSRLVFNGLEIIEDETEETPPPAQSKPAQAETGAAVVSYEWMVDLATWAESWHKALQFIKQEKIISAVKQLKDDFWVSISSPVFQELKTRVYEARDEMKAEKDAPEQEPSENIMGRHYPTSAGGDYTPAPTEDEILTLAKVVNKLNVAMGMDIERDFESGEDTAPTEAQELGVSEEVLDAAMSGDVQAIQRWYEDAQRYYELAEAKS